MAAHLDSNSVVDMPQKRAAKLFCKVVMLLFALWQFGGSLDAAYAQRDTVIPGNNYDSVAREIFPHDLAPAGKTKKEQVFRAILIGGAGVFGTTDDNRYSTYFQPTAGIDLYAIPGGLVGLLVGARFGFLPRITQSIAFGLRQPLGLFAGIGLPLYLDLGVLFFDDKADSRSFETGLRGDLAAHWPLGRMEFEARLAGEFRGFRRESSIASAKYPFWVGAELGLSFSLLRGREALPRRDSIIAAIRYIATPQEMAELTALPNGASFEAGLDRFWTKRDLTPETELNEARQEFEKRVESANALFGKRGRLGVETDPGRVFLIYGSPSESEEAFSLVNQGTAYLLWIFRHRVSGNSAAVFIFESGPAGDYLQVFSNVSGEARGKIPNDLPAKLQRALPPFLR